MLRRIALFAATPPLLLLAVLGTALVAWPVLALVWLVDLLWWPFVAGRRKLLPYAPRDVSSASIVTVSWNGKHFLQIGRAHV